MSFQIVFAPESLDDYKGFEGALRITIKKAIELHLRHQPSRVSKSRIKRLRGLRQPQYRLRIGQVRVFYDVNDDRVEILRILPKPQTYNYLKEEGIPNEDSTTD